MTAIAVCAGQVMPSYHCLPDVKVSMRTNHIHSIITNDVLCISCKSINIIAVTQLNCRDTLVAGYQCTCNIDGNLVPVNGTECRSKYRVST